MRYEMNAALICSSFSVVNRSTLAERLKQVFDNNLSMVLLQVLGAPHSAAVLCRGDAGID